MDIQKIPAARLNPAAYNPRKDLRPGDREYEKLKRSIAEFGYVEPVIWNCRTGNVVGGHQRLKVLVDMGQAEIDCVVVDLDLRREKALNIALNKIQGDWDEEKLASLMAEFDATDFDVSLTGFEASEVDALLNRFYSHEAQEDEFDADAAQEKITENGGPVTQPGSLWALGEHRLLCADPTGPEAYEEVVCWQAADLMQTGSPFVEPLAMHAMKLFADETLRPPVDQDLEDDRQCAHSGRAAGGVKQARAAIRLCDRLCQRRARGVQRSGIYVGIGVRGALFSIRKAADARGTAQVGLRGRVGNLGHAQTERRDADSHRTAVAVPEDAHRRPRPRARPVCRAGQHAHCLRAVRAALPGH